MSNLNEIHWKALERTVGYLKGMKIRGVTHWEPDSMKIIAVFDNDFANCLETKCEIYFNVTTRIKNRRFTSHYF